VICVTRLNGDAFALNPDLIQRVEGHPDTVITLVDDTKYLVAETVAEVIREIRDYRASVLHTARLMDAASYARPLEDADVDTIAAPVLHLPTREKR